MADEPTRETAGPIYINDSTGVRVRLMSTGEDLQVISENDLYLTPENCRKILPIVKRHAAMVVDEEIADDALQEMGWRFAGNPLRKDAWVMSLGGNRDLELIRYNGEWNAFLSFIPIDDFAEVSLKLRSVSTMQEVRQLVSSVVWSTSS